MYAKIALSVGRTEIGEEPLRIECLGAFPCILRTSSLHESKKAPEHMIGLFATQGIPLEENWLPHNLSWHPLLNGNVIIQGAGIEAH